MMRPAPVIHVMATHDGGCASGRLSSEPAAFLANTFEDEQSAECHSFLF
jgi:hypothetical protein